jgi:drug/metabolite transporter (DMT)-like permease
VSDKVKMFLVLFVAILLAAAGEALAAKGMKATNPDQGLVAQIRTALGDWHVWFGILLMCGYVLLYVYSLSLAELSLVVPLSAASYLLGVLLAKFYLHEDVEVARWVGTGVIIVGVLITAWSGASDKAGD